MKKRSDFSRLMGYAGNYRYFTYASLVLSAVSALMALIPFLYIWMILRDVLAVAPDYAQAVSIPHYGWMAVLFAVLSYLIYIAALMCSHLLAFDWRLGLLSLAPVVLAFLIMATMTGKRMAEKMRQYGNALEAMSNEAVEYVRGIPVVKTFGQSVR